MSNLYVCHVKCTGPQSALHAFRECISTHLTAIPGSEKWGLGRVYYRGIGNVTNDLDEHCVVAKNDARPNQWYEVNEGGIVFEMESKGVWPCDFTMQLSKHFPDVVLNCFSYHAFEEFLRWQAKNGIYSIIDEWSGNIYDGVPETRYVWGGEYFVPPLYVMPEDVVVIEEATDTYEA